MRDIIGKLVILLGVGCFMAAIIRFLVFLYSAEPFAAIGMGGMMLIIIGGLIMEQE
jgi:hypothetical protein